MEVQDNKEEFKVVLLGNPNVGKSVVFSYLTGRHVQVANYPGTTVEISKGRLSLPDKRGTLIDTPGINTLVPMSEDEKVTRDILLNERVDEIVQIADAKNLRRALLISLQLSEIGIPFLLDLNMQDEATSLGITVDQQRLSSLLGVPVVGTIAIQKKGLKELRRRIGSLSPASYRHSYSAQVEKAIQKVEALLPNSPLSRRSIALMILSGDHSLIEWLEERLPEGEIDRIEEIRADFERNHPTPLALRIHKERLQAVDELIAAVVQREGVQKKGWAASLGEVSMHPVWGIFVLAGVLFLIYEFVGNLGAQITVDWLEKSLFGDYLNPWAIKLFQKLFFFSPFLQDLFVGPYGVITMALTYAFAIIFPIVLTFFLAFSLIEDFGYLPRLAIMLNRWFKLIGLNGKAVVPMVLGLGCDTMATMTARIMDTRKERIILTLLLALGVPCSAQLGIILGMLGSLPFWVTPLWGGVVVGVLLVVGFLSSRLLPGERSDFVMEIPPIRKPILSNIVAKTLARLEWYLKEVVPLFVWGTLVLFFLDKLRWLPAIQRFTEPLVGRILGLPPEAAEAFLIGFLRRDYGATRFFDMYGDGKLDAVQAAVALIVITLFVPCLANTLMIIKERGIKIAIWMTVVVYGIAFLVGGIVNWGLRFNA